MGLSQFLFFSQNFFIVINLVLEASAGRKQQRNHPASLPHEKTFTLRGKGRFQFFRNNQAIRFELSENSLSRFFLPGPVAQAVDG